MFRNALIVLLALCSAPAVAETIVPVTIGGTEVRLAVDDDAVRISDKLPTVFAMTQAGIPPANRLVEGFVSEADAKRMALGANFEGAFLQVQVLRNAEALNFSESDWAEVMPGLRAGLAGLDADAVGKAQSASSNQRMSDTAGSEVKVELGTLGKPTVYGQDVQSLRYVLLIPITAQVGGITKSVTLECAGAMVRLKGKLVYLYAYRHHRDGEDLAAVRAALDRFTDRAIALNNTDSDPAHATVTPSPAAPTTSR